MVTINSLSLSIPPAGATSELDISVAASVTFTADENQARFRNVGPNRVRAFNPYAFQVQYFLMAKKGAMNKDDKIQDLGSDTTWEGWPNRVWTKTITKRVYDYQLNEDRAGKDNVYVKMFVVDMANNSVVATRDSALVTRKF